MDKTCQGNVKKKRNKEDENLGLLTRHTVFVLCQGVLFASFTGTNKIIPISPRERWQLAMEARDGFCSASHKINKRVKCVLAQQLTFFIYIGNDNVIKECGMNLKSGGWEKPLAWNWGIYLVNFTENIIKEAEMSFL